MRSGGGGKWMGMWKSADTLGLGLDRRELRGVAVDEHDPAAAAIGIASERLVERLGDDGARGPFDARPDALVAGLRAARLGGLAAQTVQDIRDGAAPGLDGVNRRDLRHALAVLLLARASRSS